MISRFVFLVFFSCEILGLAEVDVVTRAAGSAWLPSFSIRYSHRSDAPHVLWAGLSWEFDEVLFGDRVATALEILRLERETRYFENASRNLEQAEAHSFD